ncbi:ABC-2 transporter permease [Faecalispora anaeroviscerum]|uniref:ABC-2 transporter permease n=1 Tax=Faecalispora anaeroviscerum TaxID=2991836 RepID=UPI0024B87ABB|nr:ABC-2 transporter permease [Faecalispora anaeroviscerum]
MKGLLVKDLMISRRSLFAFVGILLVLLLLSLTMKSDFSMLGDGLLSFMSVYFMVFLAISLFAYDETCKWNLCALSLPVSKRLLVRSRYAYLLLMMLAAICLSFLFQVANGSPFEVQALLQIASSVAVSLLLVGILVPLMYRFGTQTARLLLMLGFTLVFLLGFLLQKASVSLDVLWDQSIVFLVITACVACVLLFFVSYLISCNIMEKKEIQ